jgi:hypothetical protein
MTIISGFPPLQIAPQMSQAGHGLNEPQEQKPLVIEVGDLK